MLAAVRGGRRLEGAVRLPGDKSISHRALILNAVGDGSARVEGLSAGGDVVSMAGCLRALGVEIDDATVVGVGLGGLREASAPLDCGNSGATMRMLAGLLAGQPFEIVLTGDESLSKRPMDRVVEPLRAMGAQAAVAPLRVGGGGRLRGITHRLPVASAQVKSALLLAGLYAAGTTTVVEPSVTRDHTELMLAAMGAALSRPAPGEVSITAPAGLRSVDVTVPGDLSAAAFWLVAAGLGGGGIRIDNVGVNPTRTAILRLAAAIGIRVDLARRRTQGPEPVADLEIGPAGQLRSFAIGPDLAAELIDELPVLAVAACGLPGTSRVTGAAELRVKESDRIAAMTDGLSRMGARITELEDGFEVEGPSPLEGARVDSRGDHRVAMALGVAGLLARGTTEIEEAECASISYPGFWDQLESLAVGSHC
jgi:3-phosphoshikimate 1-carboxyvinyltransferase